MSDGRSREPRDEWDAILVHASPACVRLVKRALAQRDMRPTVEELVAAEADLAVMKARAEAAEGALRVIAGEGYVSSHSSQGYLRRLCDLQVDRATAALAGQALPSDECLDAAPPSDDTEPK